MPCPLMVITLKLHSFHITSYFYMWNKTCLILVLIFQHFYPLKLADIVVKCEIEMRPAPPLSHEFEVVLTRKQWVANACCPNLCIIVLWPLKLLARYLDVFKKMFSRPWKESEPKEVTLPGKSLEAVVWMLDYMYPQTKFGLTGEWPI